VNAALASGDVSAGRVLPADLADCNASVGALRGLILDLQRGSTHKASI
jgi:hypothetical protein